MLFFRSRSPGSYAVPGALGLGLSVNLFHKPVAATVLLPTRVRLAARCNLFTWCANGRASSFSVYVVKHPGLRRTGSTERRPVAKSPYISGTWTIAMLVQGIKLL